MLDYSMNQGGNGREGTIIGLKKGMATQLCNLSIKFYSTEILRIVWLHYSSAVSMQTDTEISPEKSWWEMRKILTLQVWIHFKWADGIRHSIMKKIKVQNHIIEAYWTIPTNFTNWKMYWMHFIDEIKQNYINQHSKFGVGYGETPQICRISAQDKVAATVLTAKLHEGENCSQSSWRTGMRSLTIQESSVYK